jgi:acetyl-CoA carboxylase biotin carboxyl carrier protein
MPLSDDDVRRILRLIDESDAAEVRVETEGLLIHVVRDAADDPAGAAPAPTTETGRPDTPEDRRAADGLAPIPAPMLGTFYRAPAPGATPFVDVGARVDEDTVVCLIEVMKMMNAVRAGVVGTITEICAANAELVEVGDLLFRVRPDS